MHSPAPKLITTRSTYNIPQEVLQPLMWVTTLQSPVHEGMGSLGEEDHVQDNEDASRSSPSIKYCEFWLYTYG